METYWCIEKNSIHEMLKDPHNYNTALIPCIKSECDKWENGMCFQLRKAGRPERPQVFSKQD
jgi:hypothetical protein